MKLKVRPFVKEPAASGEVQEGRFLLKLGKFAHEFREVETGRDESGDYAVIEEQEVDLGFGCCLLVEAEHDEMDHELGLDSGCSITLREPDPAYAEALKRQGVDPNAVNVICAPLMSHTVYFSSTGHWEPGGDFEDAPQRKETAH